MRDTSFPIVWLAAGLLLLVVGQAFRVLSRRRNRLSPEEQAERDAQFAEAVAKKVLLPDGRRACVVCGAAEATEAWPVVKRSWLDVVTFLKDLFALTPRYVVRDGFGENYEAMLCPHHKRMCVQKWNEFLSAKRTQIQRVFSDVEAEVSQLESGAMLGYLRAQHDKNVEGLEKFLGIDRPRLEESDFVPLSSNPPNRVD